MFISRYREAYENTLSLHETHTSRRCCGPAGNAGPDSENQEIKSMKFQIMSAAAAGIMMLTALGLGGIAARAADIVDTAVGAGQFKTLAAAATAAGLVETLKGDGPFTVFAPTDAAFAALPAGTVEMLLKPENKDKLAAVLTYHVVPGKVMAADVVKLKEAKTVNGAVVTIAVKGDKVMINDATVVTADVDASNGVIHVIDKVILPPAN
jgi:uncharacterized surface protein with fasciclin (FAS1) repeats